MTKNIIDTFLNRVRVRLKAAGTVKAQIFSRSTLQPESRLDYLAYSGTVIAVLLVIQFATGVLLLLHYEPFPSRAFSSLLTIRNDVEYGLLFSNLHSVGSKLIILVMFIHMFRIMLVSAHRGPRSPQWYVGVGLAFLMLFTGFSGYLLPWSQQSFWACVVGTESLRVFPVIGNTATWLLRGGSEVNGLTLTRFYWLHITLLPISIIYLAWLHIKMVWRTGVAGPAKSFADVATENCVGCGKCRQVCSFNAVSMKEDGDKKDKPLIDPSRCNGCRACVEECPNACIFLFKGTEPCRLEPIFPDNIVRRMLAVFITVVVLFGFSYFGHAFHKIPADPMLTPERIKPDWYFLGAYQFLKALPSETWGILAMLAICILIAILPIIDKSGSRNPRRRPVYMLLVIGGISGFIIFTFWGWVS